MRLLVTGGAGFIGSHYVRSVLTGAWGLEGPSQVTVLDKLTYAGRLDNLDPVRDDPRLSVVVGDVADPALVDDLVASADVVVNLAAASHVDRSLADGGDFVVTNVLGTQRLLEAARVHGVDAFVQVSTDEVYGWIASGSWTEEEPLRPSSPYSASKAGADLLALAYHRSHGVPVRVTRCANNYGPRQHLEKVVPLFLTRLLRGLPVPVYGDGQQVREWVHVDDHCRALHLAVLEGRAGEVYNVAGTAELTNLELTERLLAATGAPTSLVEHVADRPGHDRRYSLDGGKARRELGFEPAIGFDAGLRATVAWYRDHPRWWGSGAAG